MLSLCVIVQVRVSKRLEGVCGHNERIGLAYIAVGELEKIEFMNWQIQDRVPYVDLVTRAEVEKLKNAASDVPVDLFDHYLAATFFAVSMWWLDRRSRLTPSQIDDVFRSLVLPTVHTVLA